MLAPASGQVGNRACVVLWDVVDHSATSGVLVTALVGSEGLVS